MLQTKSGLLRVVRRVDHVSSESLARTHVVFAIAHCSWTPRPYTHVNGNDLKQAGYRRTGVKFPKQSALDKQLRKEIDDPSIRTLDCRVVSGLP